MFKRIVSLCMAVVLMMTMLPITTKAEGNTAETDLNAVTVEGSNSLGALMSESIQQAYEAEMEPGAYSIMGIEIAGNTAVVEYGCVEEAIVVVALYSEENNQMLCSAKAEADPDASEVMVTFEGEMPASFLTSVYMVDKFDYSPLCAAYETPMYTQEMQELMASTIENYDADRVLNLDADPTTNFAVYAEKTIVIEEQDGMNTVASADTENAVYVIENADGRFKYLQTGDVFAYPYGEEILIVKVGSVSVDGTTVTITGTDLEIEEAFSYMKIDGTGTAADAVVDPNSGDEGVTYEGLSDGAETAAYSARESGENSVGTSFRFNLDVLQFGDDHAKVKVSGSVELSLTATVAFHFTPKYQHVEIRFDSGLTGKISVSAALKGEIGLPGISIAVVPGMVNVSFQPSFVVEVEGTFSQTFESKSTAGFYVTHSEAGWRCDGYSDSTKPTWNYEQSGKIFIGLKLGPAVEFGPMAIFAEFAIELSVGFEAELSADVETMLSENIQHNCELCYSGDIKFKAELSVKAEFFKSIELSRALLERSSKLCDIYYCQDHGAFGFSTCPYVNYRITVVLTDADRNVIPGVPVYIGDQHMITNEQGIATFFLPAGYYTVSANIKQESLAYSVKISGAHKIDLQADRKYPDSPQGGVIGTVTEETVIDDGAIAGGSCGIKLNWKLRADGTLTITGTGPMELDSSSDSPWYEYREDILKVSIQEGVTSIADSAFYECSNLNSVTIPAGVTSIGTRAFYNCDSLTSISIPNGVTYLGEEAFYDCDGLSGFAIPEGIVSIGARLLAFSNGLTSVAIPNSVNTIGSQAFSGCDNLSSVTVPDSLRFIGEQAFHSCRSLMHFMIPDGVTSIGNQAFYNCSKLTSITIPDGVRSIGNGTFTNCYDLESVTISQGVTSIGRDAFKNCYGLISVDIPETVTFVDMGAFAECYSLASVAIPQSVTTINTDAFASCEDLTNVYYGGTAEQWNSISIYMGNDYLIGANIHYNSSGIPAAVSLEAESIQTDAPAEKLEDLSVLMDLSQEAEQLDAVYGGVYSSETLDSYTLKTASFSGLVPGEEYLLMSLVSLDAADHLTGENLLYVDQAPAESDGTLVFRYVQREDRDVSYVMVCGASNQNLADAEINFPQMFATESEAAVDPTVTYDGKILTEGVDYILLGDVTYTEAGQYSCFLRGICNYAGLVSCTYTVEDQKDPAINPFTDVRQSDYYYESVLWAVKEGITNGYGSDSTFCPDIECSRAQVVTFLWRAKGSPAPASSVNPFKDVPNGEWYSDAVLWAVEQGITQGYGSSDTFNPNGICTRAQVVTFLQRCFGGVASSDSNPFVDVPNGEWYTTAVLWAVEEGITNGYGGNDTFAPNLNCTRGQIVTFLYRAMNG